MFDHTSDLDWLLAVQESSGAYWLLSRSDHERLRGIVDAWPAHDHPVRRLLAAKLWRGLVCRSDESLRDIATVGARVDYRRQPHGEVETCVLVYPDERPVPERGAPVTSPFGALLLGLTEGDEIHQTAPDGTPFFLRLEKVHRRCERVEDPMVAQAARQA